MTTNYNDASIYNALMIYLQSANNSHAYVYSDDANANDNANDMYIENIINSTINDRSNYKNVISEDGEKELTYILYTNNSEQFNTDKCPITFI